MNGLIRGKELLIATLLGVAATGCGGNGSGAPVEKTCQAGHALTTERPAARLFLSDTLLARLEERAASADPAWTALAKECDALATGTAEAPNGNAYPDSPNVGPGYQGEGYLPAIATLGLCYRTASDVDATAAARYGDAGTRVLEAMSTPTSSGGATPSTDDGYGIRNYGVGMALGYDWLYPVLSATLRSRVIDSLNGWIDWYDANGFSNDDPIGNYFVGYFLAKTLTSLATEGDNAKAASYFDDVSNRLWSTLVKPAFSTSMAGGGWPEGWGYGPRAVKSVVDALWAVKTAKGLDWALELPQAADQAAYLRYFAWPSLGRMDDQGTVRAGIDLRPSAALTSALATTLQRFGDAGTAMAAQFAADVAAAHDDRKAWQKFLYEDPALKPAAYTDQPLSYLAKGPGHVAMRSSWSKDAVWGALESGSYINAAVSGEEMFNEGNLSVVVGGTPLLVNATGWIPTVGDTAGEDFVYADSWGDGGRRLYNTFFVNDSANPYNPGQAGVDPKSSSTHIDVYEEGGAFVLTRGVNIEQQYGADGAQPVLQFMREVVYARPGTFVVFDRTTVATATADQWLSFHFPSAPTQASGSDPLRFDAGSGTAPGSVSLLLPRQVTTSTVPLTGGVVRLEAHTAEPGAEQNWLSVISAGQSATGVVRLSAADGNVHAGDVVGAAIHGARDQVVLFTAAHDAARVTAPIEYAIAQTTDADHVIAGIAESATGYAVTAKSDAGTFVVHVALGGSFQTSAAGTLHFIVTASGAVQAPPPPAAAPTSGSTGTTAGTTSSGSTGSPAAPEPSLTPDPGTGNTVLPSCR